MIYIEKKKDIQLSTAIIVGLISVFISLLASVIVLEIAGYDALQIFMSTFKRVFITPQGIYENLVIFIPMSLCALSVVLAAKVGLWNIGVEGQFFMGAIGATGIGLFFMDLPSYILIPLMILVGAFAGGLLSFVSIIPKVYFGVSEILTTILLNFVVMQLVLYLVTIAWNDKSTVAIQTPPFIEAARLPVLIQGTRVHIGLLIAVMIIIISHYLIKNSVFGFELRAVGENPRGARYAGINLKKYFFLAMFISGCVAGVAGMLEVSGVVHRLQHNISNAYGFSGFVIAWISGLSVPVIIVVSYIFSGLIISGFRMQMMGLPFSIVIMLQGLILLCIIGGNIFTFYKISFASKNDYESSHMGSDKVKG